MPGHLVARIVRTCALATFRSIWRTTRRWACAARRRAPAWRRRGRPSSSPRTRTTRARSRSGRPTPERLGGLPGVLDGAAAAHLAPLGARPLGSGKAARPRRRRPGDRRCCNAAAAPHSTVSTSFQRGLLGHVQVNTMLWRAPHWEAGNLKRESEKK